MDLLASLPIDIEELLSNLRDHWLANPQFNYNPKALTGLKESGDNIMFCCPFHPESRPSCGIKVSYPYVWNCFSCGSSGNLPQLVAHVLNFPSEFQGMQFLVKNYFVTSMHERPPLDIESILDGNELDKKSSIPEEVVFKYAQNNHPYMLRRGFNTRTLRKYEIGFDPETNTITFPVRTSKGVVRFIKRRSVEGKTFLNAKGVYKKDIIYGLYYLLQAPKPIQEIYLTESETDTLACYQAKLPAGAVMGRILFEEQVKELMKAGIRVVNLFFDNDAPGLEAIKQAYSLITKMSPIRCKVVVYPGGWIYNTNKVLYKDANELLLAGKIKEIKTVPYEALQYNQGGKL